jgi:hypothetical protein
MCMRTCVRARACVRVCVQLCVLRVRARSFVCVRVRVRVSQAQQEGASLGFEGASAAGVIGIVPPEILLEQVRACVYLCVYVSRACVHMYIALSD